MMWRAQHAGPATTLPKASSGRSFTAVIVRSSAPTYKYLRTRRFFG